MTVFHPGCIGTAPTCRPRPPMWRIRQVCKNCRWSENKSDFWDWHPWTKFLQFLNPLGQCIDVLWQARLAQKRADEVQVRSSGRNRRQEGPKVTKVPKLLPIIHNWFYSINNRYFLLCSEPLWHKPLAQSCLGNPLQTLSSTLQFINVCDELIQLYFIYHV